MTQPNGINIGGTWYLLREMEDENFTAQQFACDVSDGTPIYRMQDEYQPVYLAPSQRRYLHAEHQSTIKRARQLHERWHNIYSDRTDQALTGLEQDAWDDLIEFLEAQDLNYTRWDPR